jgi:hypothetical protein
MVCFTKAGGRHMSDVFFFEQGSVVVSANFYIGTYFPSFNSSNHPHVATNATGLRLPIIRAEVCDGE